MSVSGLVSVLADPSWKLCAPHPRLGYVRIVAPDYRSLGWFITKFSDDLDMLASSYSVILSSPDFSEPIFVARRSPMSQSSANAIDIVELGSKIRLTPTILGVFDQMLSNPDISYSLIRLSDQAQIACNGGSDGRFLAGAALEDVVTWTRDQYWHPQDLAEFNRTSRRDQTPNSGTWLEYSYRASNPDTATDLYVPTMQLHSKYQLIDDGLGNLYHLGCNVDLVPLGAS